MLHSGPVKDADDHIRKVVERPEIRHAALHAMYKAHKSEKSDGVDRREFLKKQQSLTVEPVIHVCVLSCPIQG
jgi:hypothetical protein